MEKVKAIIDINDATLEKYPWGEIRWIWNQKIDPNAEQTLGQVTIYSGKKNTFHAHPNCEELMYILEGECDHLLGEEMYHLIPGMTIIIPRNVEHYAIVTSENDLKAMIFYSNPTRQTDVKE
ncbi:TPA: cupin domain-containing protein [bacterium]|nr:cupin domain-containing protein [bacterium]